MRILGPVFGCMEGRKAIEPRIASYAYLLCCVCIEGCKAMEPRIASDVHPRSPVGNSKEGCKAIEPRIAYDAHPSPVFGYMEGCKAIEPRIACDLHPLFCGWVHGGLQGCRNSHRV